MDFDIIKTVGETNISIKELIMEDNIYEQPNACYKYCHEFDGNSLFCGKRSRC